MSLGIVILAAGQGKRMRSKTPKVLHTLAEKSLLGHVLATVKELDYDQLYIVHGHGGEAVKQAFANLDCQWISQAEQRGTGHAVLQVLPHLAENVSQLLVLYGDVPLIEAASLQKLLTEVPADSLGMLVATVAEPQGLGRIVRDQQHHITRIIEERDATPQERLIKEINTGIFLLPAAKLSIWLRKLTANNAQQEYYLTDLVELAYGEQIKIVDLPVEFEQILGVNDQQQLNQVERIYQLKQARRLMAQGVKILDPSRFDLRGEITVGTDVVIDANCIFSGRVVLGNNCVIHANCILEDVELGNNVEVFPFSMLVGAKVADDCQIGPFARLRPGTQMQQAAKVGNFVEVKNSVLGMNTKANHLAYLGDATIGNRVNIGAGTITCNYDGHHKHPTQIEDGAFIGSNAALIAPVKIGQDALVGAGSVVTHDVEPGSVVKGNPAR